MLLDLVPASYKQMEMFDTEETQTRSKLMKTIDVMNNSMGQDTIRFAAAKRIVSCPMLLFITSMVFMSLLLVWVSSVSNISICL